LSLDGHGARSVILRLSRPTTIDEIIRALEATEIDSSPVVRISRP